MNICKIIKVLILLLNQQKPIFRFGGAGNEFIPLNSLKLSLSILILIFYLLVY